MNKDLEHLRTLSIFYYIVGGLIALFSCIPFIHLFIGIMFLTGSFPQEPNQPEFPSKMFGLMFTIMPLIFIIGGWTLAICTIIAGRKLSRHQGYMFCFIVAGILCAFAPFGTVLGVFTILVLLRDSVKELFNGKYLGQSFNQTGFNPPDWK